MGDGATERAAVSPGQSHWVRVLSVRQGRRFITYVQVEFGWPASRGGVVVFAVPFADAPVRASWDDDGRLVVSYPVELTPFIKHRRAELDGEVIEVQFDAQGASTSAAIANRGAVDEVASGEFRYTYQDTREADSSRDYLAARGFRGDGQSWVGIVWGLLVRRRPEVLEVIRFDRGTDGLTVRSSNREALETVARLVTEAKRDRTLLDIAIKAAVAGGQMA
jgi:hypothetical protein